MQMRNNENNTLTVIKRRTEIENTTIGEEDMKTNATVSSNLYDCIYTSFEFGEVDKQYLFNVNA